MDCVTRVSFKVGFKGEYSFGGHMILANLASSVTGIGQCNRQREATDFFVAGEFVKGVLVAVLSVGMIMESAQYHRSTR